MTPLLSVVVPVFNGGPDIVENVETIRAAVAGPLGDDTIEVVVVSDGSIDGTAERLLEASREGVRVIHYDRNLGKGYAVKSGILASRGQWIGICDADLDLDPASLPRYLDVARDERLDLAIGSKRHPDSVVQYPASRRMGSWGYQQLNRLLFGLSVRDTQVGLKVISRAVADDVVPLLLVKRFAFDLELLAVAHALGRTRVREMPVRLEYRFTGSGVGSRAVARALWDTAAIFYRLRVLKTYQRKREVLGQGRKALDYRPTVALAHGGAEQAAGQDYPIAEVVDEPADAGSEIVAVLGADARPAGNWLSAAVPYFHDPDVAAVVCPTLAPLDAALRVRVAAAVLESRLAGGSRRERYLPGNLRTVTDFPGDNLIIRRSAMGDVDFRRPGEVVAQASGHGRVVYTPETVVVAPPPPVLRPLLAVVREEGERRGDATRRTHGRALRASSGAALAPAVGLAGISLLLRGGGRGRAVGGALTAGYSAAVVGSASLGALQFRSVRVGVLAAPAIVASQVAYLVGFTRGLLR